jgi:predicted deacylase
MSPISQPALPSFEVHLTAPDIGRWLPGNTGVRGFITRDSGVAGPHVALLAIAHGNEIAGAIVLDRLLETRLAPTRGRLTFGFVNPAAYERFDPRQPTASRFIDEDINRVWDVAVLDSPRHSAELDRAREIRPLIDTVDVLFDLHSMLWPSDPLILCGMSPKGKQLALGAGVPALVVADHGHVNGRRIIDYSRFADAATPCAASLVEAGQHWQLATVDTMFASVTGLLLHLDLAAMDATLPQRDAQQQRFAEVTMAVTAASSSFAFMQRYRGGDVIARRNTLIALDGTAEIRTPYDDCLLIMPSLRPSRGHTAVRLARFVAD